MSFRGQPRRGHDVLGWNIRGNRALRGGSWKLVAGRGQPWELYDLQAERIERNILAAHLTPASPFATGFITSPPDLGKTWAEYDLKELGNRSPKRFHQKNGEGWFRADLRVGWIRPGEVIFLKPKPA